MKLARTPAPVWQRWFCGVLALGGLASWVAMVIGLIVYGKKFLPLEEAFTAVVLLGMPLVLWALGCFAIKRRWPKVFIEFYRKYGLND